MYKILETKIHLAKPTLLVETEKSACPRGSTHAEWASSKEGRQIFALQATVLHDINLSLFRFKLGVRNGRQASSGLAASGSGVLTNLRKWRSSRAAEIFREAIRVNGSPRYLGVN